MAEEWEEEIIEITEEKEAQVSGWHLGAQISSEAKTRARILGGLRNPRVPSTIKDIVYSVLADSRAVGNARCTKPTPLHKSCTVCWIKGGERRVNESITRVRNSI